MSETLEATDDYVRGRLPARESSSRKGDNGRVLVVGGSYLYHGAPVLSALAAYRTGVDLVYLATPEKNLTPVRAASPNLVVLPLSDLRLTEGVVKVVLRNVRKRKVRAESAVIGPGLGHVNEEVLSSLVKGLQSEGLGLVLDADALRTRVVEDLTGDRVVLTPHDGEFLRVFGDKVGRDLEGRVETVRQAASEFLATILLKGPVDVVSDGERVGISRTGNPGMTVGGTGDVLCGVVAGLLSKGVEPYEAALCAAYINGRAGDEAKANLGFHFMATDVIEKIPAAMSPFDTEEG